MLYFCVYDKRGRCTIVEVFRRSWTRIARKQYLFAYPLALGVINALAFFSVYNAAGGELRWSAFLQANFTRWDYVRAQLVQDPHFGLALGVAVFAGVAVCVLQAMLRAPYFRAIAGLGYPLAPRSLREAAGLSGFYLLVNAIVYVVPALMPAGSTAQILVMYAVLPFAILVVFGDYIVVFEQRGPLSAIKRSILLLRRRWPTVVFIWVLFNLLWYLLYAFYGRYYSGAENVFLLIPVTQILIESFLTLFLDLLLIFIYDDLRKTLP